MSRSSGIARPRKEQNPYLLAFFALGYWGLAVSGGDTFSYGLAIAATVLVVGMQVRARLIRRSDGKR